MLGLTSPKGSTEFEMPNTCLADPNPNTLSGNPSPKSNGFEKYRICSPLFPSHQWLLQGPKNVLFLPQCDSLGTYITSSEDMATYLATQMLSSVETSIFRCNVSMNILA